MTDDLNCSFGCLGGAPRKTPSMTPKKAAARGGKATASIPVPCRNSLAQSFESLSSGFTRVYPTLGISLGENINTRIPFYGLRALPISPRITRPWEQRSGSRSRASFVRAFMGRAKGNFESKR